jgi:hypothetical protein
MTVVPSVTPTSVMPGNAFGRRQMREITAIEMTQIMTGATWADMNARPRSRMRQGSVKTVRYAMEAWRGHSAAK